MIQARCYALGMQENVGGVFAGGEVDLRNVWPPDTSTIDPAKQYSAHIWHSAEFRSDNPQRWEFWSAVLGPSGFNLK